MAGERGRGGGARKYGNKKKSCTKYKAIGSKVRNKVRKVEKEIRLCKKKGGNPTEFLRILAHIKDFGSGPKVRHY